MPRISLIAEEDHPELADLIDTIRSGRRGALLDLYRVLLHSPPVAASWFEQSNAVRWRTMLDGRLRELVIIRIAWLARASYVLHQHMPDLAAAEGVTEAECRALEDRPSPDMFSQRERCALLYAEQLTADSTASDEIFQLLFRHFDERQIVELTTLVCFFNMATRFTNAFQIVPAANKAEAANHETSGSDRAKSLPAVARPVILVENDRFLRLFATVLDPDAPTDPMPAYSDYFRHDEPDFAGFCASIRADVPSLFPARVILVDTMEKLHEALRIADAFITETMPFGEDQLRRAPNLRLVYKFGAVPRGIDTRACTEFRVKILTIQRRSSAACAEVAIALILSLAKKLNRLSGRISPEQLEPEGGPYRPFDRRYTPNANWARVPGLRTLYGTTIGIIGLGEIGREIAIRCVSFGMKVIYFQRARLSEQEEAALGVSFSTLDALLAQSDWIVPQLPGNAATRHFIGRSELARVKKGACLVNVARADIVDRGALLEALRDGRLGGFGLDPLYEEPGREDDELLAFPNVVLLPHVAAQPRSNFLLDMRDMIRKLSDELSR